MLELQSGLNITYRHYTARDCSEADFMQIYRSTGIFELVTSAVTPLWIIVGGVALLAFIIFVVVCAIRRKRLLSMVQENKPNEMELQEEKYEEEI